MQQTPKERTPRRILIVGGGFSGTILAINLVRLGRARATLIERRPAAGRGVAYSAALDDHLLNVRASSMSAFPDDPGHFARWLAARGLGGAEDFVPRLVFGTYIEELLDEARAAAGDRLDIVRGNAVDAETDADGVAVVLVDGRRIEADLLVLATGNLPPHTPRGMAELGADIYAADPWAGDIADGLGDTDRVLIVGTGLTMVDAALLLETRGFRGPILAISRRGLLPRGHAEGGKPPDPAPAPDARRLSGLVAAVRARARHMNWRAAIDSLRPHTQGLWRGLGLAERQRFIRHLRPWWDVHRHRIAPRIAERIDALQARGQLRVTAGKIESVQATERGAVVRWRRRGSERAESLHVRRIVNCTGPETDLARTGEDLLRNLARRGLIRPDALHIGIDVDDRSVAINRDGEAANRLLAIGPMTRAAAWEIVAVPDIKVQAWEVARRLAGTD